MEDLVMKEFWYGKNILLTGHTGFKGSWLAEILLDLGANVTGCALEADREDHLFHLCKLQHRLDHQIVDIRNKSHLLEIIQCKKPDVVFHLAAQALVLPSYEAPFATWETNVIGSLNILECLKTISHRCAVVMVTTDKVYDITNETYPKTERDCLGGLDPYSSSKAAMEIAISSWRSSFFAKTGVRIASARAGNVIGGGDWSSHRIMPDLIHSLQNETVLELRNPKAVRPWQHVLEPLFGYLRLAEALYQETNEIYQSSFNFGPDNSLISSVNDLVTEAVKAWGGEIRPSSESAKHYETPYLSIDSSKARSLLGWESLWTFPETVFYTVDWYKRYFQGEVASSLLKEQINVYANRG